MHMSLQKLFCVRKCPLTHRVVVFCLFITCLLPGTGDPFIKPSLKNSRLRQLRGAGGRKVRVPALAHAPRQLRSFGRTEFPAPLRGRRVIRPRSLLPELRTREERAVGLGRSLAASGGPCAACPHPPRSLSARLAAHRSLGSPPPPLGGWALPRAMSAPKVEMRKFPAATDR